MSTTNILTIAEAADRMQVSRQRMHKLIESYSLETKKLHGRLMVIHEAELDKIPKQRKNNSAAKNPAAIVSDMITTKSQTDSVIDLVAEAIEDACGRGDSVAEISKRSGVPKTIIYGIRYGNYPSNPTLAKIEAICKAIGVEMTLSKKN